MFPMIDSPKLAKKAVSYSRFPPAGIRGSAHTVVRASDYGIDEGYLSHYEEELLIMCQIENEEATSSCLLPLSLHLFSLQWASPVRFDER
ncbi:unnamed protein product [Linum trigynum]|uniref:HpcH/HpaI aldolase/citrate lyase domain-containing protein n=1 Tax=Linum trigynum TaxID=586398 RepID=A0AAV2FTX2_9ROSI